MPKMTLYYNLKRVLQIGIKSFNYEYYINKLVLILTATEFFMIPRLRIQFNLTILLKLLIIIIVHQ